MGLMGKRLPFTRRERHGATQNGLGYRPVNDWGSGDLPAPWAEGDVVRLTGTVEDGRLRGMETEFFVVTYATSIDEGDAWYFRVWDGKHDHGSDRLHVAYPERCAAGSWTPCDYMAGFELVDTADLEGLSERERMIAAGWAFTDQWDTCPTCGHTRRKVDVDA
jgi:hypothetical protein